MHNTEEKERNQKKWSRVEPSLTKSFRLFPGSGRLLVCIRVKRLAAVAVLPDRLLFAAAPLNLQAPGLTMVHQSVQQEIVRAQPTPSS